MLFIKKKVFHIFLLILGWFCVVLGIIAFFVPFVPGFIILPFGISLLSSRSEFFGRFSRRLIEYSPRLKKMFPLKAKL